MFNRNKSSLLPKVLGTLAVIKMMPKRPIFSLGGLAAAAGGYALYRRYRGQRMSNNEVRANHISW